MADDRGSRHALRAGRGRPLRGHRPPGVEDLQQEVCGRWAAARGVRCPPAAAIVVPRTRAPLPLLLLQPRASLCSCSGPPLAPPRPRSCWLMACVQPQPRGSCSKRVIAGCQRLATNRLRCGCSLTDSNSPSPQPLAPLPQACRCRLRSSRARSWWSASTAGVQGCCSTRSTSSC